jgi:transcriptional regulator with XRE-family HTH domain
MPAAPDSVIQQRRLSFGAVVRARRTSLGMSQEDLATRAHWNRQSIVRIETATHSPYLDRVLVLADRLDLSLAELFAAVDRVDADTDVR